MAWMPKSIPKDLLSIIHLEQEGRKEEGLVGEEEKVREKEE